MSDLGLSVLLHEPRWKSLFRPYGKTVRETVGAALAHEKIKCGEITVVLADDEFIRELNKQYRGKNKPTNVLSFPGEHHLGDIVLALETIRSEARQQHKSFKDHAKHLLVHGTLHLLGYDHEIEKAAAAMEAKEIKILKKLDISNPYVIMPTPSL